MNYEEKYKEALERAKKLYEQGTVTESLGYVFPELAESEDERIRKWCISHFKASILVTKNNAEYQEYLNNKVIPWLEKQGEKSWGEKDEKMLNGIMAEIRPLGECPDYPTSEEREYYYKRQAMMDWLKSLKEKLVVK